MDYTAHCKRWGSVKKYTIGVCKETADTCFLLETPAQNIRYLELVSYTLFQE